MSQHPPAHDETVRMRGDSSDRRPLLHGNRPGPREDDETRPVTRDWQLGAPAAVPEPDVPEPVAAPEAGAEDEDGTQKLALEDLDAAPAETPTEEQPPAGSGGPWWRRRAALVPAGAALVLAAAYGLDLLTAQDSIPRSTVVAGIDIGGLSPAAASSTLTHDLAPKLITDRTVVAAGVRSTLSPTEAGLRLDVARTVDAAAEQPLNPWTRLITLFTPRRVDAVMTTDSTALDAQLETVARSVDRAPVDATIAFDGTTPRVVAPADGRRLDRPAAARILTRAVAAGGDAGTGATAIELPVSVTHVHVGTAEAKRVLNATVIPAVAGAVRIQSTDGGTSAEVPPTAIAASLTFTPKEDGTLAVSVDPAKLQKALGDQLTVFGSPATDATFRVSGDAVSVVPSKDGTGIAPAHLAEQLLPVLSKTGAGRTVTAELGPVPASFTTAQAKALGIKEQVSSFTTHFTSSASGTNIRVVAAKVDGALVKPGETFSLNTFTGPRGTAQGYVPASVISGGHISKAVGGGISQFATTMFNAVFFAGLEDVHHKTHSFYISRYPAGREATVYEGLIDLQWKNDSSTGIYVDTRWSPGTLTVAFYGTKHYEIESVSGPHINTTEPAVQEKVDDGNCTPQLGVAGFDITVTRVFHDLGSGAVLRRENFRTHYIPEAVIHCVPPAPAAPAPSGTTATPTTSPGG